ncbi:hypothetical protein BHM03_00016409 [Ensete ventricosum]|nr:hypothetical protein BHM03_00016409 [Ensete ventricosum]
MPSRPSDTWSPIASRHGAVRHAGPRLHYLSQRRRDRRFSRRRALPRGEAAGDVIVRHPTATGSVGHVSVTLRRKEEAVMEDYSLGLEETELRLGLPGAGGGGGGGEGDTTKNSGKRAFEETVDLKLKLQTTVDVEEVAPEKMKRSPSHKNVAASATDPARPPAPK